MSNPSQIRDGGKINPQASSDNKAQSANTDGRKILTLWNR